MGLYDRDYMRAPRPTVPATRSTVRTNRSYTAGQPARPQSSFSSSFVMGVGVLCLVAMAIAWVKIPTAVNLPGAIRVILIVLGIAALFRKRLGWGLLLLLASFATSEFGFGVVGDILPSEPLRQAWAERKVLGKLRTYGSSDSDQWSAIHIPSFAQLAVGDTLQADGIALKGLEVHATESALTDVDRMNGTEWAYTLVISARAHQITPANGDGSTEWLAGAGPLSFIAIYVDKQNGKIWWSAGPAIAGEPVGIPSYRLDDETLFFDLLFHDYLPPNATVTQEHIQLAIAEVLEQDAAASFWQLATVPAMDQLIRSMFPWEATGRSGDTMNSGATLAAKMRSIDLSACPPEFQNAYREHIEAWHREDDAAIEATWQNVLLIARQHGIG